MTPHEPERFSPKEFLRARRPERFSDSVAEETPILDRSMLEYHLDTMTSRSQEVEFATFARHLSEREICLNLLPQTGPTGGGDSKVDSETYPVADSLALGWYTGIGREASSERWGFAFSAKKQWQAKVRSDIAKLVQTERGYKKAFFVTNQYVRDKARAEMEDELRKKYELDVRILDRTWILDKVFAHEHQALAIKDLGLQSETRREARKGPLDMQREMDLEEIESRIQEALREERCGIELAQDSIESADLARKLERRRIEIDGLYERAEQITAKCGTEHQRLACAYQRAWTTFWWFEDYERFSQLYEAVEQRAKGSRNAYDLELLTNLWTVLQNAVIQRRLDEGVSAISARTDNLSKELDRLCQEEDQPSTALHARSLRLQMQLSLNLAAKTPMEPTLREFRQVLLSCEGLAGFPVAPLIEILTELGEVLGELPAYDELFETIVAVQTARKSDVAAARILLRRGAQQLKADQPYGAIRSLGLSLARLYKHESRADAVQALYLCGCAYERIGLLWAARGTTLSAASLAANEFWKYGEVTRSQGACYRRLKWLELQLGRIPQTLSWHEVDVVVRAVLVGKEATLEDVTEGDVAFDAILGILLLKTDPWELNRLSKLPDVLERLGLFSAWAALMYALGYEDELRDTFFREEQKDQDMHVFFLKWRDQPASSDLPARPSLYEERKVILKSYLLGCNITVESVNFSPCVELAESTLAALESLLSTGTVERMIAREPVLTISVERSDFAQLPFEFELEDSTGRPHITIRCGTFDAHGLSIELQGAFKERLFDLLVTILARIVMTNDPVETFEKLFRDERVLDRSVSFTGSFVTVANVLGRQPKSRISSWSDPEVREYPNKRAQAWDADDLVAGTLEDPKSVAPDDGEPPDDLPDHSRIKQTDIRTVSLIRETLWDKAGWVATVFGTPADEASPPILSLAFKDEGAAKQIFRFWHEELGDSDIEGKLRISIVRGINKEKPHWYRIVIGSDPGSQLSRLRIRYVAFVSRVNEMRPDSNANLERFLTNYRKFNGYFLGASIWEDERSAPKFIFDHFVAKNQLYVREAWEIGRNDPDGTAIKADDSPIIPAGQESPPIMELLAWDPKL